MIGAMALVHDLLKWPQDQRSESPYETGPQMISLITRLAPRPPQLATGSRPPVTTSVPIQTTGNHAAFFPDRAPLLIDDQPWQAIATMPSMQIPLWLECHSIQDRHSNQQCCSPVFTERAARAPLICHHWFERD